MTLKLKNFSLGQFNNDVNSSTDPDEKYKRWTFYRDQVSYFVESAAKKHKASGSMIVFGAGSLNDLDIKYLSSTFDKVVLTDVDEKSMLDGINRQGLNDEQKSKISIVQMDYSGAEETGFFKKLEELASKSAPVNNIIDYIKAVIPKLCTKTELLKQLGSFDLVLSCPVYTQIVFTQIETFLRIIFDCGLYNYDELNSILNAAYQSMPALLCNYNDIILSCAKADGLVVMFTDIVEMQTGDKKLSEIKQVLNSQDCKPELIERFIQDNGLELAISGREDLMSKIEIYDSLYSTWPFDDNKEYLSFLTAGIKTAE